MKLFSVFVFSKFDLYIAYVSNNRLIKIKTYINYNKLRPPVQVIFDCAVFSVIG